MYEYMCICILYVCICRYETPMGLKSLFTFDNFDIDILIFSMKFIVVTQNHIYIYTYTTSSLLLKNILLM